MDNYINNLNTYIELIKYTINKIKKNESDTITKSVISSVNKNISDIKQLCSNNNNNKNDDSDNESTKNNDTDSISSNDIDFIDPEEDEKQEEEDEKQEEEDEKQEEDSLFYYKAHPNQINRLNNFNKSIYLY